MADFANKTITVDMNLAFQQMENNPNLVHAMNELVLGGPIAERLKLAEKLCEIVEEFVISHNIICPEQIYDNDKIIEDAYELIENLVNIVGYLELNKDE